MNSLLIPFIPPLLAPPHVGMSAPDGGSLVLLFILVTFSLAFVLGSIGGCIYGARNPWWASAHTRMGGAINGVMRGVAEALLAAIVLICFILSVALLIVIALGWLT